MEIEHSGHGSSCTHGFRVLRCSPTRMARVGLAYSGILLYEVHMFRAHTLLSARMAHMDLAHSDTRIPHGTYGPCGFGVSLARMARLDLAYSVSLSLYGTRGY